MDPACSWRNISILRALLQRKRRRRPKQILAYDDEAYRLEQRWWWFHGLLQQRENDQLFRRDPGCQDEGEELLRRRFRDQFWAHAFCDLGILRVFGRLECHRDGSDSTCSRYIWNGRGMYVLLPASISFWLKSLDISLVFITSGAMNAAAFAILGSLQNFFPKIVTSTRVMFVSLFLCIMATLIWTDWLFLINEGTDRCQAHSCSFSLNASIICPANKSLEACHIAGSECVWMQNATFGSCETCPRICRNPGMIPHELNLTLPAKSLSIYQLFLGNILLAVGFSVGRAGSSSLYSELLQGQSHGLLMGLLVASGSVARICAPLIAVFVYELADHTTKILMPTMGCLFLLATVWITIALARNGKIWNALRIQKFDIPVSAR